MFLSLYSLLRLINQHLKRDLRHLILHGFINQGKILVQYRVDVSPHRTGGIGVFVKVERILLNCLKDIEK